MNESRIEATNRLHREGRWQEASRYREEMRLLYRSEKMKRSEAVEASWQAMVSKYPPLATQAPMAADPANAPSDVDVDVIESVLARTAGADSDLVRDVNWAYSRLSDEQVEPRDVPSLGAWSLLRWARDNNSRFFEQLLPKAMAVRNKQEEQSEHYREEAQRIDRMKQMLAKLKQRRYEELAEDAPAMINKSTLGALSNLQRRYSLALPIGATDALQKRTVQLSLKTCR